MEWTNQHGCGNTDNMCEIVVQYMCDDRLRDGVTTRTIPQTPSQCLNNDCNSDTRCVLSPRTCGFILCA